MVLWLETAAPRCVKLINTATTAIREAAIAKVNKAIRLREIRLAVLGSPFASSDSAADADSGWNGSAPEPNADCG